MNRLQNPNISHRSHIFSALTQLIYFHIFAKYNCKHSVAICVSKLAFFHLLLQADITLVAPCY